jgi:3-phosphoshikimate 1-carboxyvinyltransferase
LDCGNCASATQLLLAACALGRSRYHLARATIDDSSTRTLINAVTDLGLAVHAERTESGPTIQFGGSVFRGGRTAISGLAAVTAVSSLLLVAPCATGDLFLEMPAWPTRPPQVTAALRIMERFGIAVVDDKRDRVIIPAPQAYTAGECNLRSFLSG